MDFFSIYVCVIYVLCQGHSITYIFRENLVIRVLSKQRCTKTSKITQMILPHTLVLSDS